ncbi:X8 domain [Dillenia turbinata]|uniref:X8 domain n=1 Tax=Dillenia turbinata TaxID=194707 RepID=A0AAN8VCM1_9MAGN
MAKFTLPSFIMSSLALFLLLNSGGDLKFTNGRVIEDKHYPKTWCIAKPSSNETALSNNIRYVCEHAGINCSILRMACYYPNTLINHASVAMNLYYQANGRNTWNCDFMNSGLITTSDPSYDYCKF